MRSAQGGLCAICRTSPAVHVDHCRETGRVRALVCSDCHGGPGRFTDDPGLRHVAAVYIEGHREQQVLARLQGTAVVQPGADSRAGEPPVGSQRRPGGGRGTRSAGRSSGERRQGAAGEVGA